MNRSLAIGAVLCLVSLPSEMAFARHGFTAALGRSPSLVATANGKSDGKARFEGDGYLIKYDYLPDEEAPVTFGGYFESYTYDNIHRDGTGDDEELKAYTLGFGIRFPMRSLRFFETDLGLGYTWASLQRAGEIAAHHKYTHGFALLLAPSLIIPFERIQGIVRLDLGYRSYGKGTNLKASSDSLRDVSTSYYALLAGLRVAL